MHTHYLFWLAEIASKYRNSLIADGVVYSTLSNREMLRLIKVHLFSHIVRIPSSERSSASSSSCYDKQHLNNTTGSHAAPMMSPHRSQV